MDAAQKVHVRRETLIAAVACSVLPSLAVAFLFEPLPVPLHGADGLVAFVMKSTLVAVVLMTTLMTLGARAKVAKGGVPPLQRQRFAWLALVPRALFLRVLVYAVGAALVLAASTAALAAGLHWPPLERPAFVVFNLVLGALIGLVMTPLIQCAALADPPRAARTAAGGLGVPGGVA